MQIISYKSDFRQTHSVHLCMLYKRLSPLHLCVCVAERHIYINIYIYVHICILYIYMLIYIIYLSSALGMEFLFCWRLDMLTFLKPWHTNSPFWKSDMPNSRLTKKTWSLSLKINILTFLKTQDTQCRHNWTWKFTFSSLSQTSERFMPVVGISRRLRRWLNSFPYTLKTLQSSVTSSGGTFITIAFFVMGLPKRSGSYICVIWWLFKLTWLNFQSSTSQNVTKKLLIMSSMYVLGIQDILTDQNLRSFNLD